jgi:hypothetical protein
VHITHTFGATMTTSMPAQSAVERPPEFARAPAGEDLSNLQVAYAALNDGNLTPIVDLLDPQVYLRGPEHGHLWWQTHRTWNGPAEVGAELAQRGFSPDPRPDRSETTVGTPTRVGSCFIVGCRIATPGTPRGGPRRHVDFHEVVTMRAGMIIRLADYRSPAAARRTAAATW